MSASTTAVEEMSPTQSRSLDVLARAKLLLQTTTPPPRPVSVHPPISPKLTAAAALAAAGHTAADPGPAAVSPAGISGSRFLSMATLSSPPPRLPTAASSATPAPSGAGAGPHTPSTADVLARAAVVLGSSHEAPQATQTPQYAYSHAVLGSGPRGQVRRGDSQYDDLKVRLAEAEATVQANKEQFYAVQDELESSMMTLSALEAKSVERTSTRGRLGVETPAVQDAAGDEPSLRQVMAQLAATQNILVEQQAALGKALEHIAVLTQRVNALDNDGSSGGGSSS